MNATVTLTRDEADVIQAYLDVDPSMALERLLCEVLDEQPADTDACRWAIRRLQARLALVDAIERFANGKPLPPWAVSDLRELLPSVVAQILHGAQEAEADTDVHPDDLAWNRRHRAVVLGLADRLDVEPPQPVA